MHIQILTIMAKLMNEKEKKRAKLTIRNQVRPENTNKILKLELKIKLNLKLKLTKIYSLRSII